MTKKEAIILENIKISKVVLNQLKTTETDLKAVHYHYSTETKILDLSLILDDGLKTIKIKKVDIDASRFDKSPFIDVVINEDNTISLYNINTKPTRSAGATKEILKSLGVTRY